MVHEAFHIEESINVSLAMTGSPALQNCRPHVSTLLKLQCVGVALFVGGDAACYMATISEASKQKPAAAFSRGRSGVLPFWCVPVYGKPAPSPQAHSTNFVGLAA
jgi:hypothetical protein